MPAARGLPLHHGPEQMPSFEDEAVRGELIHRTYSYLDRMRAKRLHSGNCTLPTDGQHQRVESDNLRTHVCIKPQGR